MYLMSTTDKDFRIKNGLQVAGDAVVVGTVTVSEPVDNNHVATKSYVESVALPIVSDTAPETPESGQLWLDTVSERLHIFDGSAWIALATIEDASVLQDHIHDTSIDGNGLIVTTFVDAGSFNDPQGTGIDGGDPFTTDWSMTYSGGIAVDNFN
jgi:hypothetical protein